MFKYRTAPVFNAIAALVAATTCTTVNAELLKMEFTITYDSYEFDFGPELPTDLTVTGTVVWDTEVSSFSDNGVNSHYWEYLSFEAVAVGALVDGTDVGFTITRGPTNGNANYVIQSVHSSGQDASSMYWRGRPEATPAGFQLASFAVSTLGVTAMPEFESLLPCRIGEYESGGAFRADYTLYDTNFDSYRFNTSSISVVITEYIAPVCIADVNGDGDLNFLDISAFLTEFSAGCP